LVFSKEAPKYNPQSIKRNAPIKLGGRNINSGISPLGRSPDVMDARNLEWWEANRRKEYTHKLPTSILSIKRETGARVHPTQKPLILLEYLVKTYTNAGDTVLDFTMGSGTTGAACGNLGRNFIGIEKEETYFNIARDRIARAYDPLAEMVA
jgi:DNA modification methylase